ncbi:peptidoglycan DD-metalloendopeptidase family protein [Paraburkholderia pallida]|uniref:LysM peptidoglycan-binding domain-containing protein n=1 Tax=Paraburkholderia pallida TaxID=2547399 RepID=A0A4P7D5E1_9BURK|nr:peptidoglycan DD-metalloendopeptidase family protein [Paraburkholderia pallida]QBR01814.1 LysM peptidoglycan-binding domain-containing protein [Paraburkholderia pallida]
MRSSLRLRWHGAIGGVLLGVGGLLSGCTLVGGPALSVFTTHCGTVSAGYYCVQPGDTLDGIAHGFGQKPQDVARWNDVSPGTPLLVGQMLRMAPPDAPSHHAAAPHADEPHPAAPHPAAGTAGAMHAVASAQFVWPVSGVVIREFGEDGARGIEIAGRAGMPIKAVAAGRVVYAGDSIKTYGLMVIIKHEDGFVTAYGNNRRLLVREGDVVQRGATIAEMGTQSNGEALLQFEMREGNQAVDPLAHLPADSGPVVE